MPRCASLCTIRQAPAAHVPCHPRSPVPFVTVSAQAAMIALTFGNSETHPRRDTSPSTPSSTSLLEDPSSRNSTGHRARRVRRLHHYFFRRYALQPRSRRICIVSLALSPQMPTVSSSPGPTRYPVALNPASLTSVDALLLTLSHRLERVHHTEARPDHPRAARGVAQSPRATASVGVSRVRRTALHAEWC